MRATITSLLGTEVPSSIHSYAAVGQRDEDPSFWTAGYRHSRFIAVESRQRYQYSKSRDMLLRRPYKHAITYHREDEQSQRRPDPPA